MKNIFLTEGAKGQIIKIVYDLLMTREEITYHDVYMRHNPYLPIAKNGRYPPTQNGDIRSLF
jgi:hypothetical protein